MVARNAARFLARVFADVVIGFRVSLLIVAARIVISRVI
jgi:hypothetical protein